MSPPWMPFYVADYRADTAHLSAAEHGAYLLLIMHYWQKGGLPIDDAQLARIACMSPAEWGRVSNTIAGFFSFGWVHKRIDAELAKANAKHERRVEAGRTGGIAKANAQQTPSNASSNALASSPQPEPEEKERVKRASPCPPDFQPDETSMAVAKREGVTDVPREVASFIDHHSAKGNLYKNWQATWRQWCRSPYRRNTGPPAAYRSAAPPRKTIKDALDELTDELQQRASEPSASMLRIVGR
jgi:uncharacterized protein YdaU (DUF1376 family)